FENPQQARVIAAVEPIRHERGRLAALDVPSVKVLVTHEREKALIVARLAGIADLRQIVAVEHQARRCAMLEATEPVARCQAEEPVARKRWRRTEELDLRRANLRDIGRDAVEVGLETSRNDEAMRHATRFELDALELADLDGMIEQLVVVGRAVGAEAVFVEVAGLERGRNAPVLADR